PRRRRGRRGGRRRRRGNGEATAAGAEGIDSEADDFDGDEPPVIAASASQPEFDFDDATPQQVPAPSIVHQADAAPEATAFEIERTVERAEHPAAAAAEAEADVSAADSFVGHDAPVVPAGTVAVIDSVVAAEQVEVVQEAELADAQQPDLLADAVAEATGQTEAQVDPQPHSTLEPAFAATAPAPAPAEPAVAAPASASGSLFFVADADTPATVTRHLFEPVPPPTPAPAHNDDEQAQDRSA
ncbi:MAG: hypothetical protein QM601_12075, partial [Pseudoxanthomonas sp.]